MLLLLLIVVIYIDTYLLNEAEEGVMSSVVIDWRVGWPLNVVFDGVVLRVVRNTISNLVLLYFYFTLLFKINIAGLFTQILSHNDIFCDGISVLLK